MSRPGPTSRHLEVPRTARVWSLGPSPPSPAGELWVVCHGYRQLAERFLKPFVPLDDGGRAIVAPEGLSRFYLGGSTGPHGKDARIGATWMTREDREAEIRDYVRYLDLVVDEWTGSDASRDDRRDPDPDESWRRRVAVGFSQGCHTVCRWLALGRSRVGLLVIWGAYLPLDPEPHTYADRLDGTEIVVVRGQADEFVRDAVHAREIERIRAAGLAVREATHPGGHRLDSMVLADLADDFG